MDGLEAVELRLSEVLDDNITFRFDSEYFKKEYLKIEENIKSKEFNELKQLSNKITDFGAFSQNNFIEYKDKGSYYFIRNQDMEDMFISDDKIFIDEYVYNKLTLKLNEFDLLLQRTGSIGKSGMVLKKDLPSSANQNLAQVILNRNKINPYYVNTFLNSKIGKNIFDRLATGNVQPWLNLGQIENIKIPIFSNNFQLKIEDLVKQSHRKQEKSKTLYKQAETLLLKELDLLDFEPSTEKVAIKSFSESFGESGRLDSEYYQVKYDEIENSIIDNSIKKTIVSDEFEHIKTKFDKSKNRYNYIEIGDVNVSDGTNASKYVLTEDLPANAKIKVKKGDLLISTVRPNRGAVTIINSDDSDLVVSGAFTVLRKKENSKINIQVLQVLLRTNIYKELLLKYNVGTQYPVIKDADILNLVIPIISDEIQTEIETKIKESFKLKEESKALLELAKKAVEVAIEEGEDVAVELIDG
ncbi:MAG: hypothetical protein LGB72_01110 [Sulfurovum sp.]|nr:hypothetical protein [Sulfurovum sp.]